MDQLVPNNTRSSEELVSAIVALEQRFAARTRELEVLLAIAHDTAGTLELAPLTGVLLDRLQHVVSYQGAAIFLLDDDGEGLNLLHYSGPIPRHLLTWRWTLTGHRHAGEVIRTGQPVIIDDVFASTPLATSWRRMAAPGLADNREAFGSWMGVPLVLRGRVTGMLSVEIPQVAFYTARHAELLQAVAAQAALAVENARLYEQARGLAALEERQRLARELHDSVSQALYGIGLGVRTARKLLEIDPTRVAEPLDYVMTLAEAGLTEMRALIFELRPDALESEGLVDLLDKQVAALRVRHGLEITTELDSEPPLSLVAKEALYRIAQESLNNVVKHACATTVGVRLQNLESGTLLEIRDDGIGFDTSGSFPGHLGLRSMRERAARQGAVLTIESAPGAGATMRVLVPTAR